MNNNKTDNQRMDELKERMKLEFEKILKASYTETKRAVKIKKDIDRITKNYPSIHH